MGKSDKRLSRRTSMARAKGFRHPCRFIVKIVLRHRREALAFAAEEAADIATVLPHERIRLVLRMTLEKNEKRRAFLFPNEGVRACRCRARKNTIAARSQRGAGQTVIAGVGH